MAVSSLVLGVDANRFLAPNNAMTFRGTEDLFLNVSFVVDPNGEHAQSENNGSFNIAHMNGVFYEVLRGDGVKSRDPAGDSPADVETKSIVGNVHGL